jgi:hypothetical protein
MMTAGSKASVQRLWDELRARQAVVEAAKMLAVEGA